MCRRRAVARYYTRGAGATALPVVIPRAAKRQLMRGGGTHPDLNQLPPLPAIATATSGLGFGGAVPWRIMDQIFNCHVNRLEL